MALQITDTNFKEVVLDSDKLSVIDFWAEWCGPCKMIAPIVDELANEYAGKANIGKVDVDTNQEVSFKFNVRSIPTLVFFKNGKEVDRLVGAAPKATIQAKIDAHL
jgi:thioredoxin 1